jgi:hypothetical protein
MRPVASHTAQSPTRPVVNAAIICSITRRAPRNRSSTNLLTQQRAVLPGIRDLAVRTHTPL